jgi:hypothetical protein
MLSLAEPATGEGCPTARRPAVRAAARRALGAMLIIGLDGCGSSMAVDRSCGATTAAAASSARTGSAVLGELRISDAYVPQQTSPDEAAAYLTITNDGGVADELVAVRTATAAQVMLHATVEHGGVGTMTAMSALAVPAQGTARLAPGHEHLMIMGPVWQLSQGQALTLTLTFAHAGSVDLTVPVVGLTGPE